MAPDDTLAGTVDQILLHARLEVARQRLAEQVAAAERVLDTLASRRDNLTARRPQPGRLIPAAGPCFSPHAAYPALPKGAGTRSGRRAGSQRATTGVPTPR